MMYMTTIVCINLHITKMAKMRDLGKIVTHYLMLVSRQGIIRPNVNSIKKS